MKDKLNTSALLYLLVKSTSDCGAPFGFVHDIELANRCLSDALNIVRNEMKDVH